MKSPFITYLKTFVLLGVLIWCPAAEGRTATYSLFEVSPLKWMVGQVDLNAEFPISDEWSWNVGGERLVTSENEQTVPESEERLWLGALYYPQGEGIDGFFVGPRAGVARIVKRFDYTRPISTYAVLISDDHKVWHNEMLRIQAGAQLGWRWSVGSFGTAAIAAEILSTISESVKVLDYPEEFDEYDPSQKSADRYTKRISLRVGLAIH